MWWIAAAVCAFVALGLVYVVHTRVLVLRGNFGAQDQPITDGWRLRQTDLSGQ
jgi:hypothetical protein